MGLGAATETLRKEESRQMRNLYLGNPGLKPQTWVDEQAYERPSGILIHHSARDAHQMKAPNQGTLSADMHSYSTDKLARSLGSGSARGDNGVAQGVVVSPRSSLWASRRTRQSEESFRLQVVTQACVCNAPARLAPRAHASFDSFPSHFFC